MQGWKKEHCSEQPEELQLIAPNLYMQRKNIEKIEHEKTETTEAYTEYVCECREITESEYQMLESVKEIDTEKAVNAAIDDYTMQLMEGGIL